MKNPTSSTPPFGSTRCRNCKGKGTITISKGHQLMCLPCKGTGFIPPPPK